MEETTKIKSYISIPEVILSNPDISANAKLLYGVILSRSKIKSKGAKMEWAFTSNTDYMETLKITQSALSRSLAELKEHNLITIVGLNHTRKIFPEYDLFCTDTPLEKESSLPNLITQEQHTLLRPYLSTWGKRVSIPDGSSGKAGTKHTLVSIDKSQGANIIKILSYLTFANESPITFFRKYKSKLDPKWLASNNITEENILSSTVTFKDSLRIHLDLLQKGTEKENGFKLVSGLDDFFLGTIYKKDQSNAFISWFLYWICKPTSLEIKREEYVILPLTRKYPDKFTQYYKAVGESFNVNLNRLDKTPTELNNQVLLLAEALIDDIREKNKTLPKKAKISPATLPEDVKEFLKTQEFIANFNPTQFMPGRRSWNNLITFLSEKTDPCYRKSFDVLRCTEIVLNPPK
jgi:hypothetical protein